MENNTNSFDEKKKKKLTVLVIVMLACILACIIVAGSMFGLTLARYQTLGSDKNQSVTVAKWGVETTISEQKLPWITSLRSVLLRFPAEIFPKN